jgi:hypothetical protein
MGCRLSYDINVTINGEEFLQQLNAEYSCSFETTKNANVEASAHQNSPPKLWRFKEVLLEALYNPPPLEAEYSCSFSVCGTNITSANPTLITVDNDGITSDRTNLLLDTNNPG